MPHRFASAAATRFAAHWVADALAGDEGLDFSAIKALVGGSPESLSGAPEATRERVALRCLQEVAALAAQDGAAGAAAAGALGVDEARSCEDLLLKLIGEVGSSGNLEKDKLPPFIQDIQSIICIQKSILPETSFELLKEVGPEIESMTPPSQLGENGTNQCDDGQSLCSSHNHVDIEKPEFPADSAEHRQETLANFIQESDARNLQKDPIAPTSVLHQDQPCSSDIRFNNHSQEDNIDAADLGARPPGRIPNVEGGILVGTIPASASCNADLQGNINEPLSKKDTEDHTTMVQPQSHGEKSPHPPHYINRERPHDVSICDQSSKDPSHEGANTDATAATSFDRGSDALPTIASEHKHLPELITAHDTTMVSQTRSSKTYLSAPQHESGEKVNQDLDDISVIIQPAEKDHVHEELIPQAATVLLSVSCNAVVQGGKPETNHPKGNATEHSTVIEEQNSDKSDLGVSATNKANRVLHDDGSILEKNAIHGGLNVQTLLHEKVSESNYLSEPNTGKNRTGVQKGSCSISVLNSAQNGDRKNAMETSKKKNHGDVFVETPFVPSSDDSSHAAAAGLLSMANKMPFWSKDQNTNDSLGGLSQQDLCIKCGKEGQLLKCRGCFLAAHDSCFGSSVIFEETDLFYCPVCFYTKATGAYQKAKKTYYEARKNLAAFLGTTQLTGQHDEQLTEVLPGAANREGHSNDCDSSKRKNINQNEAYNLACRHEETDQKRKKQKLNATGNGCPEEVVTEKASHFQNSDVAPMNRHTAVQKNTSKRVHVVEKQQQVENRESRKEVDNDNAPLETRSSSDNRCSSSRANQEVEADKDNDLTNSHQSDDSDEIEATSSNDTGKRSSPPWRNMRQRKAKLQEKETVLSSTTISNSRKTIAQQDQHVPSSRKRNYAYPQKRYSNPAAPSGRRSKLCWTEEEETALKEAMVKFVPKDDGTIPWVQMLEYGRDVFHKTRLPSDLRVKWRNMQKKAGY